MRTLICILALLGMTACALAPAKQMSREEWLRVTTREYEGVTVDQVLIAAEKLLRLADGDDFSIAHVPEGMQASRKWMAFLGFMARVGTDYWTVRAIPTASGTRATAYVNTQAGAILPLPVATPAGPTMTVMGGPSIGIAIEGPALYNLFWARLDFLLGKSTAWTYCRDIETRVDAGETWGVVEPLCNSFNVANRTPESVRSEHSPVAGYPDANLPRSLESNFDRRLQERRAARSRQQAQSEPARSGEPNVEATPANAATGAPDVSAEHAQDAEQPGADLATRNAADSSDVGEATPGSP